MVSKYHYCFFSLNGSQEKQAIIELITLIY